MERKDTDITPGGYCSLGLDSHHQLQQSRDLTYLEPVSGLHGQYDEIKEEDEIHGSPFDNMSTTNETKNSALTSTLPHSESFPFPSVVNRNVIRHSKRNSL